MSISFSENHKGKNLIFLISLPRSGSTMLQKILAGHPDISSLPEPWIMLPISCLLNQKRVETEYDNELAQEALAGFLSHIGASGELLLDAVRLQAGLLYDAALKVSGKSFFLDKTPRYYTIIPEIYQIFPEARFIILLRNPLATMASALSTWFNLDTEQYTNDKNYSLDMLQGPCRLCEGIRYLGEKAIVVSYEELVDEPKKCLKDICQYLTIPFYDELHLYNADTLPVSRFGDQSEMLKQGEPIVTFRDKWKSTLNTKELREFGRAYIEQLGPGLINELGYSYSQIKNDLQ